MIWGWVKRVEINLPCWWRHRGREGDGPLPRWVLRPGVELMLLGVVLAVFSGHRRVGKVVLSCPSPVLLLLSFSSPEVSCTLVHSTPRLGQLGLPYKPARATSLRTLSANQRRPPLLTSHMLIWLRPASWRSLRRI